jgi:microcin C transport system ATP-binding protein
MVNASEAMLRKMRGNRISFIFQEPMTSLNPLHTLEKQLAESLLIHQGLGAAARDADPRASAQGRHPGPRDAAGRLSAPAVGRAAAAGDDRHGAGERAGPADRGRAHDRARRHDPGADPEPAGGPQGGRGDEHAVHHPRPRHRAEVRGPGLRDEGRRDRGEGPTAEIFANPRHPYTIKLLSAEAPGAPPPVPCGRRGGRATEDLRIWFPIQRGLLKRTVGYVKAVNAATLSVRKGETVGIVGESGRARRRWRWP